MALASLIVAQNNLVAQLTEIVSDSDLENVTVTNDAGKVESASRVDAGCILVGLPDLTSPNFQYMEAKWEVHIIVGPPTNVLAAFGRLAAILDVLFEGELNIERAEPTSWPAHSGQAIPAYTITLNE